MSILLTTFDHAYVVVSDLKPYLQLAERGFAVPDRQREHPGGVTCRFLPFKCRPNPAGRSFQYLEFVQIADLPQYAQTQNALRKEQGLSPRPQERFATPGFSVVARDLDQLLPRLQSAFPNNKPTYEHTNYRWQEEATVRGPGWSYIKFKEDILPFCEFWLTEYDPDPEDPNRHQPSIQPNPNTCHEIVGCVWNVDRSTLEPIAKLCGGVELAERLSFSNFFIEFGEKAVAALPHSARKKSGPSSEQFLAMVLGCSSLTTFKRLSAPDHIINYRGQEAAVLLPYESGWAILVIETSQPVAAAGPRGA
jgi:hypothetical protein